MSIETRRSLGLLAKVLPAACLVLSLGITGQAKGEKKESAGEKIFNKTCFSCHRDEHSNVIDADKTIARSKVLEGEKELKAFLAKPHGEMPAFKTIVASKSQIAELYKYLKSLK
ncbi:MAG: c-type cytochrome [Terriglobales bacterium]